MVDVTSRLTLENGLREESLTPQSYETARIQVFGMKRPEPHVSNHITMSWESSISPILRNAVEAFAQPVSENVDSRRFCIQVESEHDSVILCFVAANRFVESHGRNIIPLSQYPGLGTTPRSGDSQKRLH